MAEDRSRVPKVMALPAPDELRKMPLTPLDGFVLSRVDGISTEEEIVGVTGLPSDQVRESLERLASLSLVALGGGAQSPARPVSGVGVSVAAATEAYVRETTSAELRAQSQAPPASGRTVSTTTTKQSPAADAAAPTAAAKPGGIDLSVEEQQRIVDLFEKLDDVDHYAVLGVSRSAEKKEIKRAYFERAATYHPDRYFRRDVGPFKPKLEVIFARMTAAHDVLTDKVQRAEYDQYLGHVALTRELEDRVKQGAETVREAEVAARENPERIITPEPSKAPAAPLPFASGPGEIRRPSRPIVPIDQQARRDLLAKHLRGGRMLTPSAKMPAVTTPSAPLDPEALRRHYEQRKNDVARAQANQHKVAGDEARARGDAITAASSYKAALSFLPDDAELQKLYAEASQVSDTTLVETYRNQATYEEKNNRWADAAKSWTKVARLLPNDGHVQERAGNAILFAKGSLHDAAAFAQRAVTLAPQNADYRKLLANIYLEAGLLKNARREIEAAEHLAPGDEAVATLARRLANATGR